MRVWFVAELSARVGGRATGNLLKGEDGLARHFHSERGATVAAEHANDARKSTDKAFWLPRELSTEEPAVGEETFEAKVRRISEKVGLHGIVTDLWHYDTLTAFARELTQCEPQPAVTEEGFCEWVCPKPTGYLMQCCDCGLVHEVEFRVAQYEPNRSEVFKVVEDPDLQAQLRMRRRDDL